MLTSTRTLTFLIALSLALGVLAWASTAFARFGCRIVTDTTQYFRDDDLGYGCLETESCFWYPIEECEDVEVKFCFTSTDFSCSEQSLVYDPSGPIACGATTTLYKSCWNNTDSGVVHHCGTRGDLQACPMFYVLVLALREDFEDAWNNNGIAQGSFLAGPD